jgi:small subunit ribosomal protein S1
MLMGSREPEFSVLKIDADFLEDNFQPDSGTKQELDQCLEKISDNFRSGTIVAGVVVAKESGGIVVGVGYKSDGYIPSHEFSGFELDELKVGTNIEVFVEKLEDIDGKMALSYQKAKSMRAWSTITKLFEDDQPIKGMVTSKVKGGLSVDVGIPAFLPGSQIDLHRVTNFDQFVGKDVTCKIIKVNRKRGNVILSRRKYLEEARDVNKKEILSKLEEGQVIVGVVKNITNYGAFVDVGGIDGLLHITDMSWGRIGHPSEMVKIGDELKVKILSFDKEHEKISLGMKQLKDNPWENIERKYPIGTKIKGRVSSIADYGLFVEIEQGIEGLVHISEISWTERVHNLSKRFTVGDQVDVVISAVDKDNRRMSLSIKRMESDPWEAAFEKLKAGDKIKGIISNIADFGVFVQIFDGVDGLVHVSDISWTEHVTHPSEKFKKDDQVNVVVLSIDKENRRISLGIKQLENDPWETIEQDFLVGKEVEGTVSKITNFGAFIKFDNGIEGLAHVSELTDSSDPHDKKLEVGNKAKLWVVKVSKEDRKLGLSMVNPANRTLDKSAEKIERGEKFSEKFADRSFDKSAEKSRERFVKDDATDYTTKSAKAPNVKGSLQLALEKMKPEALQENKDHKES